MTLLPNITEDCKREALDLSTTVCALSQKQRSILTIFKEVTQYYHPSPDIISPFDWSNSLSLLRSWVGRTADEILSNQVEREVNKLFKECVDFSQEADRVNQNLHKKTSAFLPLKAIRSAIELENRLTQQWEEIAALVPKILNLLGQVKPSCLDSKLDVFQFDSELQWESCDYSLA